MGRSILCVGAVLAASTAAMPEARSGPSPCTLRVAPSGSLSIRFGRNIVGTMEPGLHDASWRLSTILPVRTPSDPKTGALTSQIRMQDGTACETETTIRQDGSSATAVYRITPREPVKLHSLHVALEIPTSVLAGGVYVADGVEGAFPEQYGEMIVRIAPTRDLTLRTKLGEELRLQFAEPIMTLLQDNRQWGPSFTVRIGPQMDAIEPWPAGKPLEMHITLTSPGGVKVEQDGPVTLEAGADWIPLDDTLEIEPGSALDLSSVLPWHAPAGSLGRVIPIAGGRYAFAKRPGEAVRFYGINLCFSAQYLSHEESDRLARRLRMLGYNAVRFHHYESELVDRSNGDGLTLRPDRLDQLDYLFAALKKQGIYMTTDLFVSRPIRAASIWPGETGDAGMDEFKMAVPVNERAFANFRAFAEKLLGHVNPYTGATWGRDPALAWLSLINEGNPGNFIGNLTPRLRADWIRAWREWLTRAYPDEARRREALGGVADSFPPSGEKAELVFAKFLAENQRSLLSRSRAFLKGLPCSAYLTNMNSWTNPIQMMAVRNDMDYVDDHFYVDHPEFVERPWQLPSRCPNTSPVAAGARGGLGCASLRVFGKPFTVSEYNYSGPGRFRGVGGILTGALGSIQDWSVLWRFAYSHSRENLFRPGAMNYFDMVSDPLNQAAERASVFMFRRGDLAPARNAIEIVATEADLLGRPASSRSATPSWNGLAWVARIGYASAPAKSDDPRRIALPLGWADPATAAGRVADPFATDAADTILAEMRRRSWLPAANRTSLDGPVYQTEKGELTIDAPRDTLTIDTARTAGGYAPEGERIAAKSVEISIVKTDATVWVSSLDDKPIGTSRRLLITHLTDVQNSGVRYGDRDRRLLLDWGGMPHLALDGAASVTIRLRDASKARVWSLALNGKRLAPVSCKVAGGSLIVPLQVNHEGRARMLYEVQIPPPAR